MKTCILVFFMLCSGEVITSNCYERLVKETMTCPLTGVKLKETDIIPIIRVRKG